MTYRRQVPAWQVQAPGTSYSLEDYVFILTDELDWQGYPKTRLIHRLTPVDQAEQERLRQIEARALREQLLP